MKNYFKIGLMALTLAFGVTSCDKQDNGGSAVNALSLQAQGLASEVKLMEDAGMAAPKGVKNLTSKNASLFTHRYTTTPQDLVITNSDGEAWAGTYVPNDVRDLTAGSGYAVPIILANGDYSIATSNDANLSEALVLSYLPYTSAASFTLNSQTGDINLESTLLRGFLIVDVENTGEGRVTGATVAIGDGLAVTLNGPNSGGDYWGYLQGGDYTVSVAYNLNGGTGQQTLSKSITDGVAYTINLDLEDNADVPGTRETSATVTSTELAIDTFVNSDTDKHDIITREDITTHQQLNDIDTGESSTVTGTWSVLEGDDYSAAGFTHDGANPINENTDPFVDATFSAWGPAYDNNIVNFTQERTVSNSEANLDDSIVLELSREVVVTSDITLAAVIGADGVLTYTAVSGDVTVGTHDVAIPALEAAPFVDATFSAWGEAFLAQTANFTQTRTVSNPNANLDDSIDLVLSRDVVVSATTVSATAGVAGSITYSADNGIAFTHSVEIPALPLEDVDVSWTDSTVAGLTSYVGSDTDYNFGVAGSLNDVQISGIAFPKDIVIVVPGYSEGIAYDILPTSTYTLRGDNVLVIGAPIADVVALIQAAINL